jgi:aryl-alcohol dehydrogenase-like predicted oxidoreductase
MMHDVPRVELAPGYSIATVINGCWQLTPDHGGGPVSRRETLRVFAELVERGFTTFDCADIYVGVEDLLGEFRRQAADPDAIQIHTKFVPDRATLHLLQPQQVDAAIDQSRRRLGVEQLDLVQCHWWRYEVPGLEMMLDRLREAQARGRIRLIGTTNFDTAHIEAMLKRADPIVSLQAQYSLLDRRPQRRMTALAERSDVKLLPYGVLAGGFLSERYLGAMAAPPDNRSLTKYRLIIDEAGGWDAYQALLHLLKKIARRHATTIDAIAARWVLDQPSVAAIILGVGRRSRAHHNANLARLVLDDEDHERIARQLSSQPIPAGDMYALERDPDGVHAGIIKTDLNAETTRDTTGGGRTGGPGRG